MYHEFEVISLGLSYLDEPIPEHDFIDVNLNGCGTHNYVAGCGAPVDKKK